MRKLIIAAAAVVMCAFCRAQRATLDLSGQWQSSLGVCHLPGTTDENHLGGERAASGPTSQLTRLYPYTGQVTYERNVVIDKTMEGRHLSLYMERTKPSTLWVDGDSIGSIGQLFAPHVYELPQLKVGAHHIIIRIDNSDEAVPAGVRGSHAWTDATQTNWNGIIGRFAIDAKPQTHIADMQFFPDLEMNEVVVRMKVFSSTKTKCSIALRRSTFTSEGDDECCVSGSYALETGDNDIEMRLDMGENPRLWSEFHPDLYTVAAVLKTKKSSDEFIGQFGMRSFTTDGTQFVINGQKTFLRGTHDGCVFPLTGYAPASVEEWRRMFSIAKEYGINHYRFHSYTPTEAAFQAADELGIYLHTELPLWGTIDSTTVEQNEFLRNEAFTTLQFLGNHPSFVGLGLGNELWGDAGMMRQWLDDFRAADDRHLYSMGSNNDLGWHGPKEGEDFYITCRVGGGEGFSTHARTSFSFADADNGGILNSLRPNTMRDFSSVVPLAGKPIVSHETCQFQIYPDYRDIPKYTGVLYPYSLETFRERLKENFAKPDSTSGTDSAMPGQPAPLIDAFHQATGRWAVECYKADMEMCLRTPGFGGYQLLDIKDYPGQGSALVGILDAFMDTKGLVTPERFRQWNSPVVPLALLPGHCFENTDTLRFDCAIANYSEEDWHQGVEWKIEVLSEISENSEFSETSEISEFSEFSELSDYSEAWQGDVTTVGTATVPLDFVERPSQLRLTLKTGKHENSYNLWVYTPLSDSQKSPSTPSSPSSPSSLSSPSTPSSPIIETDTLSAAVEKAIAQGGTVLLTPRHASIERQSVGGLFTPDYWNYAMFKTISENNGKPVSPGTLGMLMNPAHPVFRDFPTEGRSDWQWWSVALNSRPLVLNSLAKDYLPVILTVDNVERNHKLGILMEFRIGKGRLLLSTTNLAAIAQYPEGRAYANALRRYAASDEFRPQVEIAVGQLRDLLYGETKTRDIQGVRNITDYKNK